MIKCSYCGKSLWAQTLTSGSRLYREQARTRSHIDCPGDSKSIRCEIPDDQIGRIVGAIVLPEAWMDRVLARIQVADEVTKIQGERIQVEQRLKRLGDVYLDGLKTRGDYVREKKSLGDALDSLVVPGFDATQEAGKLLEDLPTLWEEASLPERRKFLLTMLDAIYVDTVQDHSIVAIRPKPAFQPLFEITTTRQGSDVVLINEPPEASNEPEAADLCSWWRRGRVELPVQKAPQTDVLQACSAV